MDEIANISSKQLKKLIKDPRFNSARAVAASADQISAPAFAQERVYGTVVGKTLAQMAKAEVLRQKSEALPQNTMKGDMDISRDVLSASYDKGSLIEGET